jgi:lipopolysaccharide export LptBFGC system permease protein LptF
VVFREEKINRIPLWFINFWEQESQKNKQNLLHLSLFFMDKVIFPISLVTFIGFFYVIAVAFNFPYPIIAGLFGILPFFIVWMVYKVLKDGEHSGKTFEKHFYEYE